MYHQPPLFNVFTALENIHIDVRPSFNSAALVIIFSNTRVYLLFNPDQNKITEVRNTYGEQPKNKNLETWMVSPE